MCDGLFWCCRHRRLCCCCCCCFCCVYSVLYVSRRLSRSYFFYSSAMKIELEGSLLPRYSLIDVYASLGIVCLCLYVHICIIFGIACVSFFASNSSQKNVLHKARQTARPSRRPPTSHSWSQFYLSALSRDCQTISSVFFLILLLNFLVI